MPQLVLTILLIAVGWFLLIRPQQARIRAQRAVVAALEVGDRVVTAGGIHATITAVAPETVRIEVAPGVELTLARAAVGRRIEAESSVAPTRPPRDDEDVASEGNFLDEAPNPVAGDQMRSEGTESGEGGRP